MRMEKPEKRGEKIVIFILKTFAKFVIYKQIKMPFFTRKKGKKRPKTPFFHTPIFLRVDTSYAFYYNYIYYSANFQ